MVTPVKKKLLLGVRIKGLGPPEKRSYSYVWIQLANKFELMLIKSENLAHFYDWYATQ